MTLRLSTCKLGAVLLAALYCGACDVKDAEPTRDAATPPEEPEDAGTPTATEMKDAGSEDARVDLTLPCSELLPGSTLPRSVNGDQTWSGVISVTGTVSVYNARITIQPGTTFVMAPDSSIDFGWNSSAASVFARGTKLLPIRFCGKQPTAGYYAGLTIGSGVTTDSQLEHVVISEAGGMGAPALRLAAAVSIKHVHIERSGSDGVHAAGFAEDSEDLTVVGVKNVPVVLTAPAAATRFPGASTLSDNGSDVIAVSFEQIREATTFRDRGVPYVLRKGLSTSSGAILTIEPGVTFRVETDQLVELGWNSQPGSVFMNGTSAKPILFERATPTGAWSNLRVGPGITTDSVLTHVTIKGAASALTLDASITLDHVTLAENQAGLILNEALSPRSTALEISSTAGAPVVSVMNTAISLPKDGRYAGNTNDWVVIKRSDLTQSGTLGKLDVPYRLQGDVTTHSGAALTIEAGTTIQMSPDAMLEIGWNNQPASIEAVGTPDAKIRFVGAIETPGSWQEIVIGSGVLSNSRFEHVEILHGGRPGAAALWLRRAFQLSNSRISGSAGYAIRRVSSDTTDYTLTNNLDGNAGGTVLTP